MALRFRRFVLVTTLLLAVLFLASRAGLLGSDDSAQSLAQTDAAKAAAAAAAAAAGGGAAGASTGQSKADGVSTSDSKDGSSKDGAKPGTGTTTGGAAIGKTTKKETFRRPKADGKEDTIGQWSISDEPVERDPRTGEPTLRDRLLRAFPYDMSSAFPSFIWQTWKTTPSDPDFAFRAQEATWSEKHPAYIHEVITDAVADMLVREFYGKHAPEVVEAWDLMPHLVMRADMFRYLILLARGGIYADIDTEPLKSAWEWVPGVMDYGTYGLVVGIEADSDRPDWADWYSRRVQLCQWVMRAKPGHPALVETVARITEKTLQTKGKAIDMEAPHSLFAVIEWTGPAIWTDAIFAYLNAPLMRHINQGNVPPASAVGKTDPDTGLQVGSARAGVPAVLPMLATDSASDAAAAAAGGAALAKNLARKPAAGLKKKASPRKREQSHAWKRYIDGANSDNASNAAAGNDGAKGAVTEKMLEQVRRIVKRDAVPDAGPDAGPDADAAPIPIPAVVPAAAGVAGANTASTTTAFIADEGSYSWRHLTGITEAQRIGDVVVLPITGFSPGMGHMGSLAYDDPHAMVRHDFAGSWKAEEDHVKPALPQDELDRMNNEQKAKNEAAVAKAKADIVNGNAG